jgi:hypothetical protein
MSQNSLTLDEFIEINSFIKELVKSGNSKFSQQCLSFYQAINIYNNKTILQSVPTYLKELSIFIESLETEIPSTILLSSLSNDIERKYEGIDYYNLFTTLNESPYPYNTIQKMISMCPFTIYFIDNISTDFVDYAVICINNLVSGKKIDSEFIYTTYKLFNCPKLIQIPAYQQANVLYKYEDILSNKSEHIISSLPFNKLVENYCGKDTTLEISGDTMYIYKTFENSFYAYISYLVTNRTHIATFTKMTYTPII